uniref:NADH-ubiquinone oxidoreductase chain 3 n=1 Tax=Psyllaephagus populi TaxID=3122998 RepID=A0AAU7BMZ4_9HYME
MMYLLLMFIFFLLIIMMMIHMIISKKMFKDREKMSSFECGFDPLSLSRLPFSLQFYLVTIIFLIFDVEIALIMPFIFLNQVSYYLMILNLIFIVFILLSGLFAEWLEGGLRWF